MFYYLSVVILPLVLPLDAYKHFLALFCAVTICSFDKYNFLLDIAQELFLYFVNNFKKFYGDFTTSNVHNLTHVTDEVRKFGPLNTFNSYPFENKLHLIKKMLREGNKSLPQAGKRLSESVQCVAKQVKKEETQYPKVFKIKHHKIVDYGKYKIS